MERRLIFFFRSESPFTRFQALGYIMDVYRNDVEVGENPVRYALFVSFFPQLVVQDHREIKKSIESDEIHRDQIQVWDVVKKVASGGIFMVWGTLHEDGHW